MGPVRHKRGTLTASPDARNRSNSRARMARGAAQTWNSRTGVVSVSPVRAGSPSLAGRIFALAAGLALTLVLAISDGARGQAGAGAESLRERNTTLAARSKAATLDLYALQTRLAAVESELARTRVRAAEVRRERQGAAKQLAVARHAVRVAERRLADRVRQLYERGETDPVAILLGADSLDAAVDGLDGLRRFASQDRAVLRQSRSARRDLAAAIRALARREAALASVEARAEAEAASLARARAERAAYLRALASERALNARRISRLDAAARAAAARSTRIAPQATPSRVVIPGGETASGRTLTVVATGYAIKGTTASGIPVGWGVVAVDPAVIPLGTRMTIPGYGAGVAADVGGAVRGAMIDLWFPTEAQALTWGRRTVTITLH